MIDDDLPVVKHGTWLYAGFVPCKVKIVLAHTLRGSGDCEDPPEVRDERKVEHFRPVYCGADGSPLSEGGFFFTLKECVEAVEKQVGGPVSWE